VNLNRRHGIGFDARAEVQFDPLLFRRELLYFTSYHRTNRQVVNPVESTAKSLSTERSGRLDRTIIPLDVEQFRRFQIIQNAVEVRNFVDEPFCLRVAKIARESPGAQQAVDLVTPHKTRHRTLNAALSASLLFWLGRLRAKVV